MTGAAAGAEGLRSPVASLLDSHAKPVSQYSRLVPLRLTALLTLRNFGLMAEDVQRNKLGRASLGFPLMQQLVVLTLGAMLLDGGAVSQLAMFTALAYWTGFVLIMVRRRQRLTGVDRMLIRWGFLMLLPITGFVSGWVWSLHGY